MLYSDTIYMYHAAAMCPLLSVLTKQQSPNSSWVHVQLWHAHVLQAIVTTCTCTCGTSRL